MLDDQLRSLSPDNRNAYYDILNRKKNRLGNQILKKKKQSKGESESLFFHTHIYI